MLHQRLFARLQSLVPVLGISLMLGTAAHANPPAVDIAQGPLFSSSSRVNPNMVLALSVEFPTTGTAYRGSFSSTQTYIGYWDPMGCYTYTSADGYFKRAATATKTTAGAIECSNQWSGNLLNWAASSAIDMLRYAMTGGDRVTDTTTQTVLQRAVLQKDFYRNGSYFPGKSIAGNLNKFTPLVAAGVVANRDTIYFNSCLNKLFIGSTSGGSCDDPGNDQRYGPGATSAPYFTRVEVCTATEGPIRPDLCLKYPNNSYKPVGSIQTYAEQMRFSAFGYLMDGVTNRYGGVLRAPMRYTGPKKFNTAFNKVDNANTEWDADTGVFVENPLTPGTAGLSGVVNYLNRFGRTGATQGKYKNFDPVSELYYESIRYLQGKVPSSQAIDGMTDAMKDGYPVYNNTSAWGTGTQSNWDPVVASCQRNYVLTIGDLNTHRDKSLPGMVKGASDGDFDRAYDEAQFEPNTSAWTNLIGAFENKEAIGYSHPSGKTGLTTAGNAGPLTYGYSSGTKLTSTNVATLNTGSNNGSFGMAGMAYWANTQKIRADYPDVRVRTFTIDVDEGGDGTIRGAGSGATNKRGSAFYLAAKYGGFVDSNNDGNPFKSTAGNDNTEWAEGTDSDGNPKPANYFLASQPTQMIAAIRKVFQKATAGSGTVAGGAVSGARVTTSGSTVYVPQFNPEKWSGSLLSYALTLDATTGVTSMAATANWNAGALLTGNATTSPVVPPAPTAANRKIFTMLTAGGGATFQWASLNADTTAKTYLNTTPDVTPAATDSLGEARLNYLRGDRTNEATGVMRVRDSVLGDIINSAPLYVGAPSGSIQGTGYATFLANNKDRQKAVYVGANDGMLHALNAATGAELFAYVPRLVFPYLNRYTSPAYVHRPYVDAPPVAAEAQLGTSWKTVLVSGVGGGARGVFALDVTNPATFAATNVLWEFSGADDPDMGYVTQAPKILRFRTAKATATAAATYRWFAVVPSGLNNGNSTGNSALFLLALDKATNAAWQLNSNYFKIVLPLPQDGLINALSVPSDYSSNDGTVLYLYGGDTQGNLWKFDFTGNAPWDATNALAFSGTPLFVAKDASDKLQPITIAPEIGIGPGGNAVVLFGTGKFIEPVDGTAASYTTQSMYGVYDNGVAITNSRTSLQPRTATAATGGKYTITGDGFIYGEYDSRAGASSPRRGWYFDLPNSADQGERQVTEMEMAAGYLFFNTLIPNANVCGAGGGGRTCAVNAATGLTTGESCGLSTVGLLSSPIVIEEGAGAYSTTDARGRRTERKRLSVINLGTGNGNGSPGIEVAKPTGNNGVVSSTAARLTWRQVPNYKDAKAAANPKATP